ncbi:Facilitated trehalose transporter Tret1 [Atta colombica]|uniref:Facilitated trehalose transporter Tret1 n=1 Tax=Atta colombica TaxID=520822 RepID=A0A151I3T0_9HYME|nr:PREDICTED: facilitated trehalose transporter Tret1-like [Atta colombica]KYM83663.1 Facilitated trehalose transporter Tret1 [Atta colombica]
MFCANKDPKIPNNRKITVWPQWLTAFAITLESIVTGLANGWASPYLAQLTSAEADVSLKLTDIEASWVASLLSLGRVIGGFIGAFCQEYIGLKKVLLLSSLPLLSSWILNICATSVMWLYLSRFCSGVGSGIMWPAISLYLGEIASPAIRGSLISLIVNAASMGMFLGNVMGPYLSMEMFCYVSIVPNILFMVLFSLIPESPYHYALHGNIDEAEASLKWFQRETNVKTEIQELQDFVDGANTSILTKLKDFLLPVNLKNVFIMFGLLVFVQASSFSTINAYAELIVISTKVTITPSIVVMAMCFATVVAGFIAVLLVDRFGRKNLLILSSVGVAISLIVLGLHFYLLSLNFDPEKLTWLSITSLLCFNLFVACGLSTIPSTLVGEMFPANLKNLASLCIFSSNALFSFIFVKSYQPFINLVGETIVFWSYGLFVLGAVPYVRYLIPETTGKSLLEIQRSIKK